jgi:Stage II sporulation protein E (SpoIIE)
VSVVGSNLGPSWWPLTTLVIPLVLAMNVLSIGRLLVLDVVIGICLALSIDRIQVTGLRVAATVVIVATATIVMWHAYSRVRLGVASTRGDSMLLDLRDRLTSQSKLPELPRPWHAEAVLRSAGGASFAGDFIVAARTNHGQFLEVAVVDVSGKGVGAGTRALLLSGAFGGLLGAVGRADFLPAANAYLLRQEWSEGFATAIHLALHLDSGDYQVWTAGHPPAVQFYAGSGRWTPHWTDGPVLGLIPDADFGSHQGTLATGDALLLFTDGLVESSTLDITHGLDKLLGEAELLVKAGFDGGAERLVRSVGSNSDDRALLMLHRE